MLTVTGTQDLRRLERELMRDNPNACRKAIRMAIGEALTRTKAAGIRISTRDYTYTKDAKKKVAARTRIVKPSNDALEGEVKFTGSPGVPLRYFRTSPRRAVQDFSGIAPKRRKPKGGVRVKVKKSGRMRPARGPKGQSTFWFKGRNGAILLGYRAGRGNAISTEGLFGASPIQGLSRDDNFRELSRYADETVRKRINHQLDRILGRGGK